MTKATYATPNEHPNNRFIGACIDFDKALAALEAARADHFGVDAEGQRTPAEAAKAEAITRLLQQALALATAK